MKQTCFYFTWHLRLCLGNYLSSIYLTINLSNCLDNYPSLQTPCFFLFPSIFFSLLLFKFLPIDLSVILSVCLPTCIFLCVYLLIHQSCFLSNYLFRFFHLSITNRSLFLSSLSIYLYTYLSILSIYICVFVGQSLSIYVSNLC